MNWRARLTTPLTPQEKSRGRLQLALLPVYAWLIYVCIAFALDNGTSGTIDRSGHIKGHDFAHFYMLGQIANDRAAGDLYSFDAQAARMDRLVPQYQDRFLPVHPPQVALFFAPIARLPYVTAVTVWWILSALVYALSCWLLWRTNPRVRSIGAWPVAAICAGYPALQAVMGAGQTSTLALGWITLGWLALRNGRPFLAGLALGSLVYKPSLGVVFFCAFLLSGEFKILFGAALAAAAQVAAGAAWFGWSSVAAFLRNASHVGGRIDLLEAQPWQMHSLRSFFALLLRSPAAAWIAYAVAAAAMIVLAVWTWRSRAPIGVRFAVLIFSTILVDPHVYGYELVVLACAFFLTAEWLLERVNLTVLALMVTVYWLPAIDEGTRFTHFQLSVPILTILTATTAIRGGARLRNSSVRSQI